MTLRLSGLDISESTLRLLQRHMPQLERLDLAHCRDIMDSSIALLAAAGTHTRNNLTELTLAGGCLNSGSLVEVNTVSALSCNQEHTLFICSSLEVVTKGCH